VAFTGGSLIEAAIAGAFSSGAAVSALQWWFSRSARKTQEQIARHDIWLQEAERAYNRIGLESKDCQERLNKLTKRFYALVDALDEMCVNAHSGTVEVSELRRVIRRVRSGDEP
jgi:truncated hemoglobin YjbI